MNRGNQRDQRYDRDRRQNQGRMPATGSGPRMDGQPMMPPPGFTPQGPGMEGQPRMAPPNFTPELPEAEGRSMNAPAGYGRRPGTPVRPGAFRRCMNRFTYIWLINGNNFWFYPTFTDRQFVYGFQWRRNRWEYNRINMNRILFFSCF